MIAAASAVVFAATATGSALAWNGSVQPVSVASSTATSAPAASTGDAPATRATVAPAVRPAAAVVKVAPRKATTTAAKATTAKKTATKPARKATAAPKTITISRYVDAPGSQAAIDKCKLVLWTHSPLWLAGHNWCGYQWMAFVKTGTSIKVTSGAARGTYVVTGHVRLTRQSGSLPRLNADLVLQTCIGSGTGLTLLRRV
jgi:hypothetical protein